MRTESIANYRCPACESTDLVRRNGTNIFDCGDCGQPTHEKVAENREALEELASSDLPVAEMAEALLRGES